MHRAIARQLAVINLLLPLNATLVKTTQPPPRLHVYGIERILVLQEGKSIGIVLEQSIDLGKSVDFGLGLERSQ